MNILIFGKEGQLGMAFREVLGSKNLETQNHIQYVGRAQCDLSNENEITSLLQHTKPSLIINCAAYTAVDRAESEVDLAFSINAKAPATMARYAQNQGATLLHYSTDYIFDGVSARPYVETDERNPLGIYGKSKAAGEEVIEDVFKQHNTQAQFAILRTSWLYGDGDNFIRTILRLAKERETLKVIANQYGVPTSATWLAKISLDLILDKNKQLMLFPSGIYHAVPQGETTWYALACYVIQIAIDAGAELKLHPAGIEAIEAAEYPLPAPRPMNSRMATSALQAVLARAEGNLGLMTKLQLLQQSWQQQVAAYVKDLVLRKLI